MSVPLRERVLRNRLMLSSQLLGELGYAQNPMNSVIANFLKPVDSEHIFTAVNEVFIRDIKGKGPMFRVKERQSFVMRLGPQTKSFTVFVQEKPGDNIWLTTFEATDE